MTNTFHRRLPTHPTLTHPTPTRRRRRRSRSPPRSARLMPRLPLLVAPRRSSTRVTSPLPPTFFSLVVFPGTLTRTGSAASSRSAAPSPSVSLPTPTLVAPRVSLTSSLPIPTLPLMPSTPSTVSSLTAVPSAVTSALLASPRRTTASAPTTALSSTVTRRASLPPLSSAVTSPSTPPRTRSLATSPSSEASTASVSLPIAIPVPPRVTVTVSSHPLMRPRVLLRP